ncbi:MAG: patatin-like phospholipase family protein, partial [Verrucomicrobia bacterium]|nr:patatin-like phospholipase family protein [Verrucomicrobiota bacterium]
AEMSFCFLQPDTDSYYQFNLLARQLREETKSNASPLKPILCLEESERPEKSTEVAKEIAMPVHAVMRGVRAAANPDEFSSVFGSDLRRVAREIGRCRVGLALSSGAAKGLAHAGVIQVLAENGIEVDVIAGTSMGAYVGALWAFGHNGEFLVEKANELERPGAMWTLIDPVLPPRQGFTRGLGVKRRLMRSIGDVDFSALARPLRVIATNLETLERTVFSSGEVAAAVHASCAIPGICVPVEIGGELYIDGGVSDPLPVDVLREMGIEKIIAVNVIPTSAFLRCSREMIREQAEVKARRWSPLRYLNQQLNYFADGNILDIIQQSILGAQIRNAEEACRSADVVLRPLTCEGHWHDFKHPSKYVALGRRVATEHLDEIKALVKRPQPQKPHEARVVEQSVAAAA